MADYRFRAERRGRPQCSSHRGFGVGRLYLAVCPIHLPGQSPHRSVRSIVAGVSLTIAGKSWIIIEGVVQDFSLTTRQYFLLRHSPVVSVSRPLVRLRQRTGENRQARKTTPRGDMIDTLHSLSRMNLKARATASEAFPREYAKLTPLCLIVTMWLMINLRSFILPSPRTTAAGRYQTLIGMCKIAAIDLLARARRIRRIELASLESVKCEKKLVGPGRRRGGDLPGPTACGAGRSDHSRAAQDWFVGSSSHLCARLEVIPRH